MRVVFAGTPEPAVPALRALLDSRHQVAAVLTRPDARIGRGRRTAPSPVRAVAEEAGVPVLTPRSLREDGVAEELAALVPDCCPVVAYGNLVPPGLLGLPRHGWVNLHFSLLPAWRGAAPVQHAVMAGDQITGAATFLLEEGLDTGPVFGQLTETIRPTDTAGDLLDRLAVAGATLLVATLDAIEEGTARPHPQPADGVSLAPKLTAADARIDWAAPALAVDRRIRGCTPAPGAWTTHRDERLKLEPVTLRPDGDLPDLAPGQLHVEPRRVLVGTGSHPVQLGQVRRAGRAAMPAADWSRGVRPEAGERLT